MTTFLEQLHETKKVTLGKVSVWSYQDENTDFGYFLEFDKHALSFYVIPDDGYRDYALSVNFMGRMDIVFKDKTLVGTYERCELVYQEDESVESYILLSHGEIVGDAYFDTSDHWYPSGGCDFERIANYEEKERQMPKEITLTFPEARILPEKKRTFVVHGEPRTGKSVTINRYRKLNSINFVPMDTDGLQSPDELFKDSRLHKFLFFIIGKYRNVICHTNEGDMSYKDALVRMLEIQGYEVVQMEFLERVGNDLDEYAIVVEDHVLSESEQMFLFDNVSDEIEKNYMYFCNDLPKEEIKIPHIKAKIF